MTGAGEIVVIPVTFEVAVLIVVDVAPWIVTVVDTISFSVEVAKRRAGVTTTNDVVVAVSVADK